jgi:hypothetical protein
VLFCGIRDQDENRGARQTEISCQIEKDPKETKRRSMPWKTTTSPKMKKQNKTKQNKNEQVASESSDDRFLLHQRRNHNVMGT